MNIYTYDGDDADHIPTTHLYFVEFDGNSEANICNPSVPVCVCKRKAFIFDCFKILHGRRKRLS